MNDKDRELVEQVLHATSTAGVQGFEYLVRYMIWDGVVGAVCCAALCTATLYLLKRAWDWKIQKSFDDDIVHLVRGAAIIILLGGVVGFVCGVGSNIVQILAPQGAAIHSALHHS